MPSVTATEIGCLPIDMQILVRLSLRPTSGRSLETTIAFVEGGAHQSFDDAWDKASAKLDALYLATLHEREELEHDVTTAALVSDAVLSATQGANDAAEAVAKLVKAQKAYETFAEVESLENEARTQRARVESEASRAEELAEMAKAATAEWERAAALASKICNRELAGAASAPEREQRALRAQLAITRAQDEARCSSVAATLSAEAAEDKAAEVARAKPWVDGYILVTESFGSWGVERFARAKDAHAAAEKLWCCWVLFQEHGTSYFELRNGGSYFDPSFGASHARIRGYVHEKMAKVKQDARNASRGMLRDE